MDICVPYNVWRMLYTVCPHSVGMMYEEFEKSGNLCIPEKIMNKLRSRIDSVRVSNESTLLAMRDCYEASNYLLDPHTAVGVASVSKSKDDKTVCFACAHPVKFPETVREALGNKQGNDVLKTINKDHKCVNFVRNLSNDLDPKKHPKFPRGCITVLDAKRQEDWTNELRDVMETFLDVKKKCTTWDVLMPLTSAKALVVVGAVVVCVLGVRRILSKK
jgi:threonine synthase